MQKDNPLAESLNFFIYDTIKIFILLAAMIFLVSILRTFITPQKVRKWLGGGKEGVGNVLAALLGVPTPFCSCSAVPLFIGFVEAGVPLGVTFLFLISAPMVNEVAGVLLFGLLGWQITALYVISGLVIAIIGGIIIGRMKLEKEVESFVYRANIKKKSMKFKNWDKRIEFAKLQTINLVKKVGLYIIVGVGALIHGLVPIGFLADVAGPNNPLAVPIAVIIGIPLYSNARNVPIVESLMAKGMAIGTALALMISITALSLPEMILLRRVLKPKLLAIFVAIIAVCITLTGLLFNFIIK